MKKYIHCETLRNMHKELKEQGEICQRHLIIEGITGEEFLRRVREFQKKRKEMREYMKERLPADKNIVRKYDTVAEYRTALEQEGYMLGDLVNVLFDRAGGIPENAEKELTSVKVTAEDLGLTHGGTADEILEAAKEQGLEPCPPWVALQYRLDCDDDEDFTYIGMEPLYEPFGNRNIFAITHDDFLGPWLQTKRADDYYLIGYKWIFVSRR